MVILRPKGFKPSKYIANEIILPEDYKAPCFVIHPPTSKLAEMLVVDSTALKDENYSGVYDEGGDYIPQYCDNPEEIPQGALEANKEAPAPQNGAEVPKESPSSGQENPTNGEKTE